ncbi:MAG TPA: YHYH protein, partial [Labilithrix sp.]|nr:YHYH protein [Labilithrix sp.]
MKDLRVRAVTSTLAALTLAAVASACGETDPTAVRGDDGGADAAGPSSTTSSGSSGAGCSLTDHTTPTTSVSDLGCAVLARDTTPCEASRKSAGLSGFWLKLSCRVALSIAGSEVIATSDNRPDYTSNYFPANDPCHETFTKTKQNPNVIAAKSLEIHFPRAPAVQQQQMKSAIVGLALNGVAIFGNFAAPGDDIYLEAETFDRCNAHPQMSGVYHYHS